MDPHTYPDRPWPLSTLTIKHTDVYLRRAYSRIQRTLTPQTVLFLGDLLDGGREWGTRETHSPEERYRSYGPLYWLWEYDRFAHIFLKEWGQKTKADSERRDGRRIIASLPGNHDLGFGRGIQLPVRKRFETYLGEGNRVDVIGNHTFVSLDTVSLSARDQGGSDEIWGPGFDMLNALEGERNAAVSRHLRHLYNDPSPVHRVYESHMRDLKNDYDVAVLQIPRDMTADDQQRPSQLPTILLSHVPLYRPPDTNCGPLREKGKAISISSGYQYQNALTPSLTDFLIETVGADGTLHHLSLIHI